MTINRGTWLMPAWVWLHQYWNGNWSLVLTYTQLWWQAEALFVLVLIDSGWQLCLSSCVLGMGHFGHTTGHIFSQGGFKSWNVQYFLLCVQTKIFLTNIFLIFSLCWIWKSLNISTSKISQEGCDQVKEEFTSGLPFVCKKHTTVLPAFFLGLKWQWLRVSFSKLMVLPSRHILSGGVKLEIQGGFW